MAIPVRPMGRQGMMASMQGYGCMGLTAFYGKPVEDAVAYAVLDRALELGITHFDSAERYTYEEDGKVVKWNEEVVGSWAVKAGRDKVTVATKYFPGPGKAECRPEDVRSSVEASLQRLGFQSIDLYYLHRIPSDAALQSFMETVKELVKEGKIKYVGLSEATPAQIRAAHAIHPLTAVQQEWSLLCRNLEADVVPTCRELGIAVVAYSPLARGFASALVKTPEDWAKIGNEGGAANGFQSICPNLSGENLVSNAKLLAPVESMAAELGVTPAQLSLAWVQGRGVDVFPIPGTTKIANLESNVGAAHFAIKEGVQAKLDGLSSLVDFKSVAGERYPEAFIGMCYEKKV